MARVSEFRYSRLSLKLRSEKSECSLNFSLDPPCGWQLQCLPTPCSVAAQNDRADAGLLQLFRNASSRHPTRMEELCGQGGRKMLGKECHSMRRWGLRESKRWDLKLWDGACLYLPADILSESVSCMKQRQLHTWTCTLWTRCWSHVFLKCRSHDQPWKLALWLQMDKLIKEALRKALGIPWNHTEKHRGW